MNECKKCCYFGYSNNPDWIKKDGTRIEHCLFRELRGDYETAPCDENIYYTGDEWDWEDF